MTWYIQHTHSVAIVESKKDEIFQNKAFVRREGAHLFDTIMQFRNKYRHNIGLS